MKYLLLSLAFIFGGCAATSQPLAELPIAQKQDKAVVYMINHGDGILSGGYDICVQEKDECRYLTNLTYKSNVAMSEITEGNYTLKIAKKGKLPQMGRPYILSVGKGDVKFLKISPFVEMMAAGGIGAAMNVWVQAMSDEVTLREIPRTDGEQLVKTLGAGEPPKYIHIGNR